MARPKAGSSLPQLRKSKELGEKKVKKKKVVLQDFLLNCQDKI